MKGRKGGGNVHAICCTPSPKLHEYFKDLGLVTSTFWPLCRNERRKYLQGIRSPRSNTSPCYIPSKQQYWNLFESWSYSPAPFKNQTTQCGHWWPPLWWCIVHGALQLRLLHVEHLYILLGLLATTKDCAIMETSWVGDLWKRWITWLLLVNGVYVWEKDDANHLCLGAEPEGGGFSPPLIPLVENYAKTTTNFSFLLCTVMLIFEACYTPMERCF